MKSFSQVVVEVDFLILTSFRMKHRSHSLSIKEYLKDHSKDRLYCKSLLCFVEEGMVIQPESQDTLEVELKEEEENLDHGMTGDM